MAQQGEDHERLLAEQRARLARIRAEGAAAAAPEPADREAPDLEAVGTSGDGAVRVVLRERRITSVVLGAGVTRQSRGEAAELLREAINRALTRSLAQSPKAGDPGPDLAALGDQMAEFARESGQAMRRIQGAVEQSMAKLDGKVQLSGDASPQHLDSLFDEAMAVVRSMRTALDDGSAAPVTGAGRDESDEVMATVSQGELTRLTLSGFALRMSPGELGQAVQQAVNDALAEWEQRSAAVERGPLDLEALGRLAERADAVRERSMQHLRTYTDSMTSIMRDAD
ncbi:hypothetical protein AB8O55_09095 [Saccharopolyspora cebuensis]|uniref:YbaB/EbfC DNA-binding family protein n=1 Tax=Saccharopolyspora cebuensis TaxID=418759 RepID=A0ABV4CHG9_9PSEU